MAPNQKIPKILIGELIKKVSKEKRIGPTELGQLVNTSKQNIYGIFKRKSIDTDSLLTFSKTLEYDFFKEFSKKLGYQKAPVHPDAKLLEKIAEQEKELILLRKVVALQDEKLKERQFRSH
ncbi:MAG: hypothetical protein H6581_31585 [Bacteroidia bacterium]|nr:hypothetical protein [Bacteroidia bacterium]